MEWANKLAANNVAMTDAVLRQLFGRLMFMGCGKVCWLVDMCHCKFIRSVESPVRDDATLLVATEHKPPCRAWKKQRKSSVDLVSALS
jgi:hypothetical protein